VRPKGIYQPFIKAKFGLKDDFPFITLLDANFVVLLRSILEKIFAPCNSFNMSSSLGMGCLYLMVMLLMALQSQHICHLPFLLGTNNTGIT